MKKLLMIINPVAGRKSIQHMIPQIVRIFMDAGYLCTVMVTAEAGRQLNLSKSTVWDSICLLLRVETGR